MTVHTIEQVAKAHQKLLRFYCCLAAKAQHFLVRICNLFDNPKYDSEFMEQM